MTNNMALSGLRIIVTKLYLPQMAPLDVQRVTHGAKGFWHPILVQDNTYQCSWCKYKPCSLRAWDNYGQQLGKE